MSALSTLLRLVRGMDVKKMREAAVRTARISGRPAVAVLCDMLWCGVRYQAGYSDYALFEMWRMNAAQRGTVLTRGKNNRYVATLNDKAGWAAFGQKTDFLRAFSSYVNRAWLDLETANAGELERFGLELGTFIVKPKAGTCGQGVEKVLASAVTDWAALRKRLLQNGQNLCEEVIVQHPDLDAIWPGCINTVRLVTILCGETVHIVAAYLRVGSGARPVDNFNSGGMVMPVDRVRGVILAHAVDKAGYIYERHPVTDAQFCGFHIPMWQDCLDLAKRAALVEPRVRYIGWDIAVRPNGPALVEGNHFPGHDIYGLPAHAPDRIGVLPDWEAILPLRML